MVPETLHIAGVITNVVFALDEEYGLEMLSASRLISIRQKLKLSQEGMARVLCVSFASVNRWEGGHSGPTGSILDLYLAIEAAIRSGNAPDTIRQAANNERGAFLYTLFRMAYAPARKKSR